MDSKHMKRVLRLEAKAEESAALAVTSQARQGGGLTLAPESHIFRISRAV